jgi:hypothetical protein
MIIILICSKSDENTKTLYLAYFLWNEKSRITAVDETKIRFSYQKQFLRKLCHLGDS